jgi:hypothetical protein
MNRSLPLNLLLALFLAQDAHAQSAVSQGTHAQSPIFGVFFTAGLIDYIPSHGPTRPLDNHTWLTTNDKLKLADNIAEVILFARDTTYVQLEGKGSYTAAGIAKLPRHTIRDPMMIRYFSFFWPSTISTARSKAFIIGPRPGYTTSQDSLIFSWHNVSWARKYFLRLRNGGGDLVYDSVLIDTQAVVHFPGRMPAGYGYNWALDIVGEGGRLQFADSGHVVLIDETKVLPQLPALALDSLGGIAVILEQIEQFENAGCIRQADILFQRLLTNSPMDAALDKLYADFRERNCY